MKKLILVLVIALLAVPAFGLNITLNKLTGQNIVDVCYADACSVNLPRAFALRIDVNNLGKILGVVAGSYKTGTSESTSKGYGIYPARIVITTGGAVTDWGSPLADPCDPGAAGGPNSTSVVLEFGSLYMGEANKPTLTGRLCQLAVDCNSKTGPVLMTATEENTYRGGVVLEDGTVPVPDLSATVIVCAADECLKNTATEYTDWSTWGKPSCWCCRRQCRGDATCKKDGPYWVQANDLNLLKTAYTKADTVLKNITNGICADFTHKKDGPYRVQANDLNTLKAYYTKAETLVHCCDEVVPDGNNCNLMPTDKYNFWTN